MRATARASNSKRDTIASFAAKSSRTILIATAVSKTKCVALNTTPMPPVPRNPSMRYFPPTIEPGPSENGSACETVAGGAGISRMVLGKRCPPSKQKQCLRFPRMRAPLARPHDAARSLPVEPMLPQRLSEAEPERQWDAFYRKVNPSRKDLAHADRMFNRLTKRNSLRSLD